jgi:lysine 6-dehydrogenase
MHHPDVPIVLADIDHEAAVRAAHAIGPTVQPLRLDIHQAEELHSAIRGSSVVVSAVSYAVNPLVTRAAIENGVSMCDLGGNNDVVRTQIQMHQDARRAGVTIVPNCGLAPGLVNVLAMHGAASFEELESIRLRVGGLPQQPRPPLNYQIVFSVDGLINEYVEPAEVIRDGVRQEVPSLTDLESIAFAPPFGELEAFTTSGGLSLLPTLLEGRIRDLDYKTIRYPGHCEKMRTLVELGFASSEPIVVGGMVRTAREIFTDLLARRLPSTGRDVVLGRVTITGTRRERRAVLEYEFRDYYDEGTGMSAMMRTTAYPTSIIAAMLGTGVIAERGVLVPEQCVPGDRLLEALAERRITVEQRDI